MPVAKKKKAPASKKNVRPVLAKKPIPPKQTAKPRSVARPLPRPVTGLAAEKLPPRLQAVLDKSDIAETLTTFARGLDRMDENLLRGVLHGDATLDLGNGLFQGTGNDYVTWVLGVLHGVRSSHHLIGNVRIELDGDVALVESYFHTHFRVDKPIGREDVFMGGRNLDRMERRPSGPTGAWKIAHRKQILDWVRTEAVSDLFYHQNPDAHWNSRTKTDPSYHMAQFPGSQPSGKLPAFLGRRFESRSVKF